MPTDQALRSEMLQKLYERRHHGNGWIMLPAELTLPGWDDNVKVNILRQLRDYGWAEWQRTALGPFAGRARITADGVHEIESSQIPVIPEEAVMPTAHPTHTQIARYGFWGGLVIAALGVLLFWLGGSGDTSLEATSILNMKTSNVGLVAFALGVILMIFTFRSVLASLNRSSETGS